MSYADEKHRFPSTQPTLLLDGLRLADSLVMLDPLLLDPGRPLSKEMTDGLSYTDSLCDDNLVQYS